MTTQYSSPPKRPAPVPTPTSHLALQQPAFRTPSPPRTPHNRRARAVRSQTGLRVSARTWQRETFLDDVTPVDGARGEYGGDEKDPHDLAFSPKHVTRASVVDNMLMLLDQYSNPITSTVASREPPNASLRYNSIIGRRRGNTFSSDGSSDNESRTDETIPPQSFQRSQRSNSNSNFHFPRSLDPVSSLCEEEESNTRRRVFDSQRAFASSDQRHAWQSKNGRKSGKSSGSSSVDLSQALSGRKLGPAGNRRSQSFDFGSDRRRLPIFEKDTDITSSTYNFADDIEAAPTPIVHAGPRRGRSPIGHNPTAPLTPIYDPALVGRRNSTKSSKSQYARKGRAGTMGIVNTKGRDDLRDLQNNLENLPPMPTYFAPHPQSPILASHKPSQVSAADLPSHSKERPGFFRRVFGSKNANITTLQATEAENGILREGMTISPIEESSRVNIPSSKLHKESPKEMRSTRATVQKEPQTITKKSSVFFRRRKKSVDEQMPSHLPLSLHSVKVEAAEPSPVSSLRQVMDPYLAGPPLPSPQFRSLNDAPEGFHTAYTSFLHRSDASSTHGEKMQDLSSQSEQTTSKALIPEAKLIPNLRVHHQDNADSTFLADSSGTEEPNIGSRQNTPSGSFDGRSRVSPSIACPGQVSEGLLPVRFPFTSTGSSRATTPSSGSRTPHSPNSPTLSTSAAASKATRPSNLRLRQEASDMLRQGSGSNDQAAITVRNSSLPSGSDLSVYNSAPTTPSASYHENADATGIQSPTINITASPERTHVQATSEDDQEQAVKIFENRDENLDPGEVSAWLGDAGEARERVRTAYMSLFDLTNVDILSALRGLCARIALKGETQQVDRMLDVFSQRWCECNCNHGFKSSGELRSCHDTLVAENLRRCSYHLLLYPATQHRLASCRYWSENDAKSVHPQHFAYNPTRFLR